MLLKNSGGGDFEQPNPGTKIARCIKIIDIGTQEGEWQGKPTHKRQGIFMWELPNDLMDSGDYAGKPFVVSRFYTLSLSEKATLRHDLESWRGKAFTDQELGGFDPKKVLGAPCMVSLVEKNNKVRVASVMALPKDMPVPPQINPSVYFSLEDFNQEVFDSLSKGIQAMIEKSPEYQQLKHGVTDGGSDSNFDDLAQDIPFFDHLSRVYWRVV